MNPFAVLGISSKNEAKAAYRKLAMKHHPDRGGDLARFQEIQAAWAAIESGQYEASTATPNQKPTGVYKSSFGDPPGTIRPPPRAPNPTAKPAPGYEARGTPKMPRTYVARRGAYTNQTVYGVDLEITPRQAFEGCVVPFVHSGVTLNFEVRPGTTSYNAVDSFLIDEMIGSNGRGKVDIQVTLKVREPAPPPPKKEEIKADHHVTYRICALGLFSGGTIEGRDYLNTVVPVQIPVGYDPSTPIVIKGKGYGKTDRGDMIVTIQPVYKHPSALSTNELKMLERVKELAPK